MLAALVFVAGFIVGEQIFENSKVPDLFIGIVFLVMGLIASLSGFLQISIEEVPGFLFPIKGKAAVFFGRLWIAFFWLMGIGTIWYYFL